MSGTPKEIARSERLAAKPYSELPDAFVIKKPVMTIAKAQMIKSIFLRVIE